MIDKLSVARSIIQKISSLKLKSLESFKVDRASVFGLLADKPATAYTFSFRLKDGTYVYISYEEPNK